MSLLAASLVEAAGTSGQDRVAIFDRGAVTVAVVADGAGGTSGGGAAAQAVIEAVRRAVDASASALLDAGQWRQVLLRVGAELAARGEGQSTAAVAATDGRSVVGASVGDSGIWRVGPANWVDLTSSQRRKPLLGGGSADPVTFTQVLTSSDRLLLATDGIFKYATPEVLTGLVRQGAPLEVLCRQAIDAARLPTGALQDDASVIVISASP